MYWQKNTDKTIISKFGSILLVGCKFSNNATMYICRKMQLGKWKNVHFEVCVFISITFSKFYRNKYFYLYIHIIFKINTLQEVLT